MERRFPLEHEKLGLGPLTMTYEMAAVVLLEQLYRCSEIRTWKWVSPTIVNE